MYYDAAAAQAAVATGSAEKVLTAMYLKTQAAGRRDEVGLSSWLSDFWRGTVTPAVKSTAMNVAMTTAGIPVSAISAMGTIGTQVKAQQDAALAKTMADAAMQAATDAANAQAAADSAAITDYLKKQADARVIQDAADAEALRLATEKAAAEAAAGRAAIIDANRIAAEKVAADMAVSDANYAAQVKAAQDQAATAARIASEASAAQAVAQAALAKEMLRPATPEAIAAEVKVQQTETAASTLIQNQAAASMIPEPSAGTGSEPAKPIQAGMSPVIVVVLAVIGASMLFGKKSPKVSRR